MARSTLSAARAFRIARAQLVSKGEGKEGEISAEEQLKEDGKGALVISAVGVAVAAATIRVGGRAALVSVSISVLSGRVAGVGDRRCKV